MQMSRDEALRDVRVKWLRVQSEVAYLRMLFAGQKFREALRREAALEGKYRPDQPRVPAGNSDGGRWTDEGGDAIIGGGREDRLAPLDQVYSVNLMREEMSGGHAVRDHVAKSDAELLAIVERNVIRTPTNTFYKKAQGTYLSIESATDFTNRILQENIPTVDLVAKGVMEDAWLDKRLGYPTGKEAYRPGPGMKPYIRPTYSAGVYIVHDPRPGKGYRVHTSYPHNEYPEK